MSVSKEAIAQIKNVLGVKGYIESEDQKLPFLTSWRNGWTGSSPLIALPHTSKQVSEIIKICFQNQIGVVPQGGNTGLVGGAVTTKINEEIILSLSRMDKIHQIDKEGFTIIAESGVILKNLQNHVENEGYLFPLSMASEGSAQLGGIASTNAGGTSVLRYGNMRQLIYGLEVVLPNGEILNDLRCLSKDNTGYDLSQFFIGAEGTLGIITTLALKLYPLPKQRVTLMFALPTAHSALEIFKIYQNNSNEFLNAFEIISSTALLAVLEHNSSLRSPFRDESPYYLLVELSSSTTNIPLNELAESIAEKTLELEYATNVVLANNMAQSRQFWSLRESISESLRKKGPGIHFDISLPISKIIYFLSTMGDKILKGFPQLSLAPFGHVGDGNLHYNMYFNNPLEAGIIKQIKSNIQSLVYDEVKCLGGSISAEHGIGLEKKTELLRYKSVLELELMRRIKESFDPHNVLNSGKIFDLKSSS